ncbi:sulfur carrier protein ThiS [Chlorobium limicola]
MPDQQNMITIQLNGEPDTLPEGSSLEDLLAIIGSEGKTMATLVNDLIVRPENRAGCTIQAGDRIELLIFAGGG